MSQLIAARAIAGVGGAGMTTYAGMDLVGLYLTNGQLV